MTLTHILIFSLASALTGWLIKGRARNWILLVGSLIALYWLQPGTPIPYLDFWLPTASLALTVVVWVVTRMPAASKPQITTAQPVIASEAKQSPVLAIEIASSQPREEARGERTFLAMTLVVLAIAATRYLGFNLTPSRPPEIWLVALVLIVVAALALACARFLPNNQKLASVLVFVLLGLFIVLKTDPLAQLASAGARVLAGRDPAQAVALDWRWLGFSYIAFRLIHALRDRITKRLPAISLQEFVTYALFFPTLTAGPIDRAERFVKDMRAPASAMVDGGTRLIAGVFKKFALADTLAIFALNELNAAQTHSAFWTWILLYAYALRIYFDFSGYTDIALGLGRLLGFKLPENFDRPYLKPNLTVFWNSWHITLAQWFRAYFFNPLTRALRTGSRPIPPALIVFIGQTGTMLLIGLWHGVTWNFVLWGLWHAAGLFIHSRWAEFARPRLAWIAERPVLQRVTHVVSLLFTFHYVALGWVWFALPSVALSWAVMLKLFGM